MTSLGMESEKRPGLCSLSAERFVIPLMANLCNPPFKLPQPVVGLARLASRTKSWESLADPPPRLPLSPPSPEGAVREAEPRAMEPPPGGAGGPPGRSRGLVLIASPSRGGLTVAASGGEYGRPELRGCAF